MVEGRVAAMELRMTSPVGAPRRAVVELERRSAVVVGYGSPRLLVCGCPLVRALARRLTGAHTSFRRASIITADRLEGTYDNSATTLSRRHGMRTTHATSWTVADFPDTATNAEGNKHGRS
jgi:hypothetical protein